MLGDEAGVYSMRRIKVLLLAVLFAALWLIIPILAENDVYFTAINNTLLELDDATMPVKLKGTYYLPSSVFNSSELGIYCVYFKSKQLVMLSNLTHTLYFDMSAGNSYDDLDEVYPYAAIYQNNTAYLPADFTAVFFDCECSCIKSDYAPIIRLSKGDVLSETAFLRGASALMAARLAQYRSAKETLPPAQSPTPTASEAPRPTETPRPTESPRPDRSSVEVYLAFLGLGEDSEACAELLCGRGYTPCFFVRAEEIRQQPDLIRKLIGLGCGIGFLFERDLEKEYREAAPLLREAARTVTFLAASTNTLTEEALEAAKRTGLLIWCAQEPETETGALIAKLDRATARCDLILDGSMRETQAVQLANHLQTESYSVRRINELTETAPMIISEE